MKNPVQYLFKKEMLEIRRGSLLKLLIIAPIFQVIIFGYVATTDIKNVKLLVCDEDRTAESRLLTDKLLNNDYFVLEEFTSEPKDIDRAFSQNRVIIAVRIPKGLGSAVKSAESVKAQVIVDGTDSNMSLISMNRAIMIINGFSRYVFADKMEAVRKKAGGLPLIEMEERVWYNPELRSADTMVPGVIGFIVMLVTLVIAAVAIVREKENGNLEQMVVTPVRPYQIILGKTLPYALIGLLDIVLVTVSAMLIFRIPFAGNFLVLIGLSLFFILANLGIGIYVSTISSTQQQAMLSSMFFALPNILLSGFIFPIKNMPEILQFFTYIIPMRYYMVIIRGVFLKGTGIAELFPQVLALLLMGIILFTLAIRHFKKTAS